MHWPNWTEVAAIIAAVAAIIGALKSHSTGSGIKRIEFQVNGRMTDLLNIVSAISERRKKREDEEEDKTVS